jgi:hypothetical protein
MIDPNETGHDGDEEGRVYRDRNRQLHGGTGGGPSRRPKKEAYPRAKAAARSS